MASLSPEINARLELAVDRMPAFPKSVQKILELSRNINCAPKELIMVIEKDPVMTIKILKVLNSVYYSLPSKITSVSRAVVYIGINTVKNLALSFAAVGMLPSRNVAGFDIDRYLQHSLVTAGIARQLAQKHGNGQVDPMDCYVAGLLHDFGKVVFAQFMAAEFQEVLQKSSDRPLHEIESESIGVNHAVVGAMLIQRWNFPETLVECVRDHHENPVMDNPMSECLFLADTIAKRAAEVEGLPPVVYDSNWRGKHIVLSVDRAIASLGDLTAFSAEAQMFKQASRT